LRNLDASMVYWSEFLAAEGRCIVFPVRYELNLYMLCRRKYTVSVVYWSEFLATERRCIVFPVRYELNLYMLCRRK
jgi:hypothetical protein